MRHSSFVRGNIPDDEKRQVVFSQDKMSGFASLVWSDIPVCCALSGGFPRGREEHNWYVACSIILIGGRTTTREPRQEVTVDEL